MRYRIKKKLWKLELSISRFACLCNRTGPCTFRTTFSTTESTVNFKKQKERNFKGREDMKCLYSQAILPKFVNPTVPPTKKKPFSTILAHAFVHTVRLVDSFCTRILLLIELDRLIFCYQRSSTQRLNPKF